jgi:uncharacterized protein (DUF1697 family)
VMRRPLGDGIIPVLEPYRADGERMQVVDGDLWLNFTRDMGNSKLLSALTPRRLGGAGTSRNWNTVRRLGEMIGG